MSLMTKIFGSQNPSPVPAAPAAGNPAAMNIQTGQATEANQNTAPNGVVPANSSATPAKESPLGEFKDLWQPVLDAEGKPVVATDPNQNLFNVDPTKVRESAAKLDFKKVIKPEQLQAIASGGEGAVAAFAEAMNQVAQESFAINAQATAKIVEQAITKTRESMEAALPGQIRSQNVSEAVRASNPIFNNPAASMMVDGVRKQLEVKFPQASASELATLTNKYFDQFANELTAPSRKAQEQSQTTPEFDWDAWAQS